MSRRFLEPTRRDVLIAGASLAAVSACPPTPSKPDAGPRTLDPQPFDNATRVTFAPVAVQVSEALFPQTVAAGAMAKDSVLLWTRAAGVTQVKLRVWREVGSETEVALVTELTADVPAAHGNVKVRVPGLAPATWYSYAFFSADLAQRSPIGRVRTAFPDDWKEPLIVGATSCASYRYRPFKPLETLAKQPMDLWLHLGDVAYNDGATVLEEFRQKWREQFIDPGYRALMPAAGGHFVWDDHEFTNNIDVESQGLGSPLVAGAITSFKETLAIEDAQLWRSYRWGLTAEFFLLDLRTERKATTRGTPQETMISPAQLDWLRQGLEASPCHFKVVLTSVPMANFPEASWPGRADRWQGYQVQREQLLSFIDEKALENVWFLSGDIHLGTIHRIEAMGSRRKFFEICVGPAGNVNPLSVVLEPGNEANRKDFFPPSQFLYAAGAFQATTLTFDPQANTVRVVFLDPKQADLVTCDQQVTFGQGA
ncbi:MAG: alkaline phosphatase D family protein [Myxococcales bacterium]|nr:alkaline phosphatase D family protein [Myxococcales bacterium]